MDQPDETNGVDAAARRGPRPWLGVRFDCCNVYIRVYRNRDGTAYAGRCPSCGRAIHVPVGPDGCSSRFFIAS
ncbi:MAG: hypothetical protein HOP29_14340 [Phycisphaerales bacterium]|nr:hypothetical protein [Phycisphaerales bacterium]